MRPNRLLSSFAAFAVCAMSSCSGLPKTGGGGGGGGGNGSLPISLTLSSVPAGVPGSISILSFTVNLSGLTLTSQTTGAVTNLSLTNFTVDLNKLLSDSAFLGQFLVVSDQYSKIQISIASSSVVSCTSTSGVAGCTPASITRVSGGPSTLS